MNVIEEGLNYLIVCCLFSGDGDAPSFFIIFI